MSFHEKVYFGVVHNLLAFPAWKGESEDGLAISSKLVADPFFEMLEAGWIKDGEIRNTVRKSIIKSKKEVTYCCGPTAFGENLDINSRDESVRSKSVERLKELAEDALDYGASLLLICSGQNAEDDKKGEALRLLTYSVNELCEYCRRTRPNKPLVVSLEIFDWKIDKKRLLGPMDECIKFAENIVRNNSNFSLTLDLSHIPLTEETPESSVPRVMPFLQHVHVGNCVVKNPNSPFYGDKHPEFGVEDGEISREQVQNYFRNLEKYGYLTKKVPTRRPVIVAEVIPPVDSNIEKIIENIKQTLKK
ncbi:MAG TPA: TIM barrel protein [bacterium]|nr:TIM barrel protein [bacterium]